MKATIHKRSSEIFFGTLGIYLLILVTVTYVGVYVTYVAGPVLLVSGLLAYWTRSGEAAEVPVQTSRVEEDAIRREMRREELQKKMDEHIFSKKGEKKQ